MLKTWSFNTQMQIDHCSIPKLANLLTDMWYRDRKWNISEWRNACSINIYVFTNYWPFGQKSLFNVFVHSVTTCHTVHKHLLSDLLPSSAQAVKITRNCTEHCARLSRPNKYFKTAFVFLLVWNDLSMFFPTLILLQITLPRLCSIGQSSVFQVARFFLNRCLSEILVSNPADKLHFVLILLGRLHVCYVRRIEMFPI